MKILRYIMILLFVLAVTPSAGTSDDAVTTMQQRYAAINSMKAEFTQTLTHKESGNAENRRGVLFFAKPLRVRWETVSPIPEILLVTPEAVWNVFPDEDMAYKYPAELSGESENIMRVITGQSALDKDFSVEIKDVKDGVTTVSLFPRTPTQSMVEAELAIETKTGLIRSVVITDFYYNRNEIVFTSQELNPAPDTSLFTFTPAKGMKVEDRTKGGSAATPLLR